ncbi:MAG: adenine deaminase [Chitinophagales bacterium]
MNVQIKGNLVDIFRKNIYPASLSVEGTKIKSVEPLAESLTANSKGLPYILPGFVDAHVHIESSMLVPSEFARLAVVHGTVATVSDPHEIANVCGMEGVSFMIENGNRVPFKFYFGAPSCVPATSFETAGAVLNAVQVDTLLNRKEIKYLSEMMNYPGVLTKEEEVIKKIQAAQKKGKPVDGHAPGLRGEKARQYIDAGISTDHECFTSEEALDKLKYGMKIIIREGSAARNFDALIDLLKEYPEQMMFCSDDKHPDSLVEGHVNRLCARAIARGIPLFHVLRAACLNPVLHYQLELGLLRTGDPADFIVVNDLNHFDVLQTYVNGELVAENGKTLIPSLTQNLQAPINKFQCGKKSALDFSYSINSLTNTKQTISIIEALDGQLITGKSAVDLDRLMGPDGRLYASTAHDILKIVVVNRYAPAPIAKSFIKNFGLKHGALASSVAHDSHNIVAVGVDDESLSRAVNLIVDHRGGISCVGPGRESILPLPVAGLMSMDDGYRIANAYTAIDKMAKTLGSTLSAPFMTLSFMALLVIPHLKLSDLGLFDGDEFRFISQTFQ